MKPHKPSIYLALLLALMPLTGCGHSQEQISAPTATAQTAAAARWTPTGTATATLTPITTPTTPPTQTLTPTSTSSSTPAPTQTAASYSGSSFQIKDLTFSIVVPEGWKKVTNPNNVIFVGPTYAGIQTILSFSLDQYSMAGASIEADDIGISLFTAHVQDTISGMVQNMLPVSEDFLNTPDGKPYFRWILEHDTNGKQVHQAMYIYGSGKWFLTAMYGRAKSAGTETDVLIDETMTTLMFGQ